MDKKPVRRWQDIATELMNEFDPSRVVKLASELNEALAEDLKKPVLERQPASASETARVRQSEVADFLG
jgi:hypothetical protein